MAEADKQPDGGEVVKDFAAEKRARLEAKGETFTFTWVDGNVYELPSELPMAVLDEMMTLSEEDGMKLLFGGEDKWKQFRHAEGVSDEDWVSFQTWLFSEEVYDMGKYERFEQPSRPTGRSSKPTSKDSTKRT